MKIFVKKRHVLRRHIESLAALEIEVIVKTDKKLRFSDSNKLENESLLKNSFVFTNVIISTSPSPELSCFIAFGKAISGYFCFSIIEVCFLHLKV